MLLAVTVVVLEMVALGLEDIVVFVLDLPPAAAGGDDLTTARLHPHRGHRRVDIGHLAVGVVVRRTVFAVERRRGAIRGPVQGKQQRVADRAVGIDHTSLLQGIEEIGVHRRQCAGWGGVEQVADLMIRGDAMGAEQGAGVISPRVCSKLRGYSKNEGLGMKNTAQALSPASTRVYRVFLPQRRSVKPSKVQRSCWVMSSKVRTKGPKGTLIRGLPVATV